MTGFLLLHGWCGDGASMRFQADRFGPSAAPDLAMRDTVDGLADDALAAAASAGLDAPVVVGHSLGGLVALACAARAGAVSAAVLLDPAPILVPGGKAYWARAAERAADADWRRRFAGKLFGPYDEVDRERVAEQLAAADPEQAVAGARAMAGFDGVTALARAAVPVLILNAEAGEDEGPIRALAPHVVVGRTVGAGHFHHLQVPDQVNAMIDRFLRVAGIPVTPVR